MHLLRISRKRRARFSRDFRGITRSETSSLGLLVLRLTRNYTQPPSCDNVFAREHRARLYESPQPCDFRIRAVSFALDASPVDILMQSRIDARKEANTRRMLFTVRISRREETAR